MIGEHQIRIRSYLLWETAGRPQGRDMEFWLRAEAELGAEARCAQSECGRTVLFVMPRVPISSPPRRRLATRVALRSRVAAAAAAAPIAASL
jgi:hypothetical protein